MTPEEEFRAVLMKRARPVIASVSAELGVPRPSILSGNRHPAVVAARHETMVRLWRSDMSISDIARALDVDHTTVIAGLRKRLGAAEYRAESLGPGRVGRRALPPRVRVA